MKYLALALFSAALLSSISVSAQDRKDDDHDRREQNRYQPYYDSGHRDWHQWNDNEEQSYRRYTKEHHRDDDDFRKPANESRNNTGDGGTSIPMNTKKLV